MCNNCVKDMQKTAKKDINLNSGSPVNKGFYAFLKVTRENRF